MKSLSAIILAGSAVLLFAHTAMCFGSRPLNVGELVRSSDSVYKVRAIAVEKKGAFTDQRQRPPKVPSTVTRAVVLMKIKGPVRRTIEIVSPSGSQWVFYTTLDTGKAYIVFLKSHGASFQYTDYHNGAVRVPANNPKERFGTAPQDILLAELMNAAGSSDAGMKMTGIEQLGRLGDIRARSLLKVVSFSPKIEIKGQALASRIQIGDAPTQKELMAILELPPSMCSSTVTMFRGQSRTAYAAGKEQVDLINAIEWSVRENTSPLLPPVKRLKDFDYISFVTEALDCKLIQENEILRSQLASTIRSLNDPKSVPLLLRLLDDRSSSVRYLGATGFAAMAGKREYYVSGDLFEADESKYIDYWKDWAKSRGQ